MFVAGSPMSFIMYLYTAYYPSARNPVGVDGGGRPQAMELAEKARTRRRERRPGQCRAVGSAGGIMDAIRKGTRLRREEGVNRMRPEPAEEIEYAVAPAVAWRRRRRHSSPISLARK